MGSGVAALLVALGLVGLAASPVAAQEIIYVRDHGGRQVFVQPVARSGNVIVLREVHKDKSKKQAATDDIYAYDCKAGALRYVDPSDSRVMKDADFHDGAYKKAHEHLCSTHKGPRN